MPIKRENEDLSLNNTSDYPHSFTKRWGDNELTENLPDKNNAAIINALRMLR